MVQSRWADNFSTAAKLPVVNTKVIFFYNVLRHGCNVLLFALVIESIHANEAEHDVEESAGWYGEDIMKVKGNLARLLATTVVVVVVMLYAVTPPVGAQRQETVASLKERIIDLQNQGSLGFRNFSLCSNVIGFGQYVPYPDNKVKAGSEIYFYYEPVNVFTNRVGGDYQFWFTQDMIIETPEGERILDMPDGLNYNFKARSPVLDLYAQNTINLGKLPPGEYKFTAVLHDKLKKADAKQSYTFEVVP